MARISLATSLLSILSDSPRSPLLQGKRFRIQRRKHTDPNLVQPNSGSQHKFRLLEDLSEPYNNPDLRMDDLLAHDYGALDADLGRSDRGTGVANA